MVNYPPRLDPVTRYVRGLAGDYLLPREAARELDITTDRLKYLGRMFPDTLGPGFVAWWGGMMLYLYSPADVAQVRAYFAHLDSLRTPAPHRGGRGRPAVWTHDEHASRHRRRALARYHRLTADRLAEEGRTEQAERNRARAVKFQADLDAERVERLARIKADRCRSAPVAPEA